MEWYNKIMCVTFSELTESESGQQIMSESNYKWLCRTGKLNVVRPGKGLDNYALIEYDTIPQRFKVRFDEKWGNPYDNYKESMMLSEIEKDSDARSFFAEYETEDGVTIPDELQEEYAQNADVLNLLVMMVEDNKKMRKRMQGSAADAWSSIYGTVERLRKNPGHTLPRSHPRLRDKINQYKKEGYGCLVSGKLGNRNTQKITEEAGMFLVMKKRCRVPVMTDKQIWVEFNRVADNYGWKKLKNEASVTNYLNAPENIQRWYDAVYGELKAFQKFGYKHQTMLPEKRDSLWYGDGTKLNLYYKAYEDGKLVVATTQVYEVLDAYSEMFLGYHISDSENYEAQYNAYRMAVELAQSRPFEIVTDNQGGHKKLDSTGFLGRICRLKRPTTPYRATGKSIEAVFGRFQAEILHKDWRFTGQNITATSEKSRQNLEFLQANKENLYTLDELKEAYAIAREEWNSGKHPATGIPRREMYLNSTNEKAKPVDRLDMIEMFWMMTAKASTFTDCGITITIDKKKYTYDVYAGDLPDFDFRKKNIGRRFFVQYDPLDLTQVRLYVKDATGTRYVTDALPYVKVFRATQDATQESSSFIRRVADKERELRVENHQKNMELEYEWGVAPEQFGLNRPELKGIGKKAQAASMRQGKTNGFKEVKARKRETVEVGEWEKKISNLTYDEVVQYDKL
ncbi:MAG: kinase [Petrimonas sp.]|nr:kinase [Petrimonas sp.]